MENTFWTALATSTLAAIVTSSGIYTIRKYVNWGQSNITYFICFAAGMLISASFLHIIPKSLSMNPDAAIYLLVGYFGLHLLNRFITVMVCQKNPDREKYSIGLVPMVGIGFHSFIDGVIYSIAFTVSIFTGFIATAGMILHEFPEGIITYLLLIRGGFSEKKAMVLSFLAAALTTPIGMLVSYPFIKEIDKSMLGNLLALSAGALIYVGATHLLPKAEQEHKKYSFVALGGGVLVAILIVLSKA
jgi:ZIP family zinc transporter